MKILLNVVGSNLGNNGGSHTLVRSANTLVDLGHEVEVIVDGKNSYTWTILKAKITVATNPNQIPNADVIIATSFKSVDFTNRCIVKNKYWWIRGWEKWASDEKNLVNILKSSYTKKLVNSIGLKNKLNQFKIYSDIIYPGYDFNEIYPLNIRKDDEIILGGLFNSGSKRSSKRTEWIFKCYNKIKEKYPVKLFMFGIDGSPTTKLDYWVKNPSIEEKNKIYNICNIWLSPSENEGLHLTPAEAMITECTVVGNNSEMNGTQDYLIDNQTGLVSNNDFNSFMASVEVLVNQQLIRKELGKAGREKILEIGSREKNMNKLIELIKG